MEIQASIKYGGEDATYSIRKDNPGIYSATLVYYTGEMDGAPPAELTLVRSVRGWTGSSDDMILLNALGDIIIESLKISQERTRRKFNT